MFSEQSIKKTVVVFIFSGNRQKFTGSRKADGIRQGCHCIGLLSDSSGQMEQVASNSFPPGFQHKPEVFQNFAGKFCQFLCIMWSSQPADIGMSPGDSGCCAGNIGQNTVERRLVPPVGTRGVTLTGFRLQAQSFQIFVDHAQAVPVAVERQQVNIGHLQHMS